MNIALRLSLLTLIAIIWISLLYQQPTEEPVGEVRVRISNPKLIYTKHALCRMECRQITESDIIETISHGKINYKKSDSEAQPCPVVAYEKQLKVHDNLRIVLAKCAGGSKVITAIKLGQEFKCDC